MDLVMTIEWVPLCISNCYQTPRPTQEGWRGVPHQTSSSRIPCGVDARESSTYALGLTLDHLPS